MSLEEQASIERGFTALVWQKLEEQNEDFFRAYYTRLKLKDQIVLFNHLLEQQVQMVHRIRASAAWMAPNGASTARALSRSPIICMLFCKMSMSTVSAFCHFPWAPSCKTLFLDKGLQHDQ